MELSKLMAPFTPFLSDVIYMNLTGEESVHLDDWPKASKLSSSSLLKDMELARQVVEKAHSIRKEEGIGVKQPLSSYASSSKPVLKSLEYLIKDEINVKTLTWDSKTDKFDTKITPELKEESEMRELVRKIQDERKKLGLNLTQKVDVKIEKLPTDKNIVQWMQKKAQIKNLSVGGFKVTKA